MVGTVALVLAACGSSGSTATAPEDGSKPVSTTTTTTNPSGADTPAFVDIQTCDNTGGSATASGTIENQGTTATGYRLRIAFTDGSSKQSLATETVQLGVIRPGATGEWSLSTFGLGDADVVCHTVGLTALAGGS